jgi:hypothetical protein
MKWLEEFPFMLSPVKLTLGPFSRISFRMSGPASAALAEELREGGILVGRVRVRSRGELFQSRQTVSPYRYGRVRRDTRVHNRSAKPSFHDIIAAIPFIRVRMVECWSSVAVERIVTSSLNLSRLNRTSSTMEPLSR